MRQRPAMGDGPGRRGTESHTGHDDALTRDRLDLLFQHCADLGLDVEWADLADHRRGQYDRDAGLITLSLLMTRAQTTSVLAHELGHHAFGDTCSTPAAERRAWEYAAALLITPAEYHWAEWFVGHHVGALAIELDVTPQVVEAWRRWWHLRGHRAAGVALPI